ncbi:hypothetical protein KI387_032548, partial [Taxus chinensis]
GARSGLMQSRQRNQSKVSTFAVKGGVARSQLGDLARKNKNLPPGLRGWPVLGCLPLLGSMPHVNLTNMSKKYGPIVYLKLGTSEMVVANTPTAAKSFLKTMDINFSNRPRNAGATHLTYNMQDMVWAPYGKRWTMLRKLCNQHMLGGMALDEWQHVRLAEIGHMLRSILTHSQKSQTVNLPELLNICAANIFGQIILSKRVFESEGVEANQFKDMVVQLMTTAGYFTMGDFIPSIAWMDLQGIERGMKKLAKQFDDMLNSMIAEHQVMAKKRMAPDILDIIMSQRDNYEGQGEKLSDDNIKSLLLDLFTAGTDTSSSVIEWSLTKLILNPKLMKCAQVEMENVISVERRLKESDIPNLPYLSAICKEGFRKHPSTPLILPRISTQACEVGGYYIPKGICLTTNIWGIGTNPEIWENPLDFNPDRFLGSKIDSHGNEFNLILFGAGRRICVGVRMGIIMVEYSLGSLIQAFDWELPSGMKTMNMEEDFGLALQKKEPLVATTTQ